MVGNIFKSHDRETIIHRIDKVRKTDKAHWGKMNASEMICHLRDQLLLAMGKKPSQKVPSGFLTTWLGKRMGIDLFSWPKGKVGTVPEMDQKIDGTPPSIFETDRQELIECVYRMDNFPEDFHPHPAFGKLTRKEWGKLVWKHLDHHLRQFGR